jgi:hypothetical protein
MGPHQPAQSDQDPCCSLINRENDSEQHGSCTDCADEQHVGYLIKIVINESLYNLKGVEFDQWFIGS